LWLLCVLLSSQPLVAAERVISLAPAISEIILELDAGERLIGRVEGPALSDALAAVPAVGRYDQLELETLISLQPDLILAWSDSLSNSQRSQFSQLGIRVYEVAPRNLAQLGQLFAEIGELLGEGQRGRQLQEQFDSGVSALRARYARAEPLTVFYQVWAQPLYTLGGQQIVSDALEVCGAQNVFAALTLPAPQVSIESVLQANPQVILLSAAQQAEAWQVWPQLAAVQRKQVWVIPDAGVERPSFQMLGALEKLCQQLQPAY
jgi:vitamin B12 transport system substrate-binding protein